MTTRIPVSRRTAIKTLSTGLAVLTRGVFSGLSARPSLAANDTLQVAYIGAANRAVAKVDGVAAVAGAKIVAMSDVDDSFMARQTKPQIIKVKEGDKEVQKEIPARFPDARTYVDYRELSEEEAGTVDAVVVSTADHHHAPASIRALRKKMHVYCEKPLAHTVAETRLLAEEAAKAGVAMQMATHIHAGDNYRRVVEIIRAGAIGPVHEVHVWVGKSWGGGKRPAAGQTPPATLHWDLWLGPAAERPFVPGAYHPANWRRWWDFGNGTPGDMGCHYMDLPFWTLDLHYPTACEAQAARGRSRNLSAGARRALRVPGSRRTVARATHLVRWQSNPRGSGRSKGSSQWRDVRRPRRDHVRRVHQLSFLSGGEVRRIHSASAVDPQVDRALRRVDRRLPERHADDLPLRILRPAIGGGAARLGGLPRGPAAGVGCGGAGGPELPGGRPVRARAVSPRVEVA